MQSILYMTLTMITIQVDMAECPEFPDPLSPHAGDVVHASSAAEVGGCGSRDYAIPHPSYKLLRKLFPQNGNTKNSTC